MTVSRVFLCSPCRQLVQTSANITRLFAGINLNRKLSFYISFLDFSVISACLHDQQNRTLFQINISGHSQVAYEKKIAYKIQ